LEDDRIDLKVGFKNDPKSWPAILKDVVAMHNSGGGMLVLGIADNGSRVGLDLSLMTPLDPTNVGNKGRRYHINGLFRTAYTEVVYYGKRYGFLFVHAGGGLLTFDKDVQVDRPGQSPEIVARPGVLYVRRDSSSRPACQNDLDEIMHRLLGRGIRAFLARVEKVASLPASTQLIAKTPGASGGYMLTAAGQGVPVRVIGPDVDAEAITLSETLLPDLPLSSIDAEIVGQLRQFNSDPAHRVQQATLRRWYLNRAAIHLPEGAARFLTLSALDARGLPCYWASLIDRDELKSLIEKELEQGRYPAREALPYLVAAFFWDQRRSLLQSLVGRAATRVLAATDKGSFLRNGRLGSSAATIKIGARRVKLNEVFASEEAARAEFDSIVADDKLYRDSKQAAYQLDLWLHADR
jgi:hypothetical protein